MKRPYPWKCRTCREGSVNPATVDYTAEMEHDGRSYAITIPRLDILECGTCHARMLPDDAYSKLTDALRCEAGLLMPAQIRMNREALRLTQKQLASHLKVAPETLSRWETGSQIQQRSMDLLLRAFFDLPELRQYLAKGQPGKKKRRPSMNNQSRKPLQPRKQVWEL